ncbi:MAG: DegT/DnrJ/EryC1/StrS family aminotransferase, partial [Caldilineaceae bacterium]|nr:DegT/DnrJ/EryC1/StrS family aminotransferase [Caldilineaceae bacterium]
RSDAYPNAQRAASTLMTLPLHPGMADDDVHTVVDALTQLATSHRDP